MPLVSIVQRRQIAHLIGKLARQRINRTLGVHERVGKIVHAPQGDKRAPFVQHKAQRLVFLRILKVGGLGRDDARKRRRAIFNDRTIALDHRRRRKAKDARTPAEIF